MITVQTNLSIEKRKGIQDLHNMQREIVYKKAECSCSQTALKKTGDENNEGVKLKRHWEGQISIF